MPNTDPFQAGTDSLPALKFENVGDKHTGQITDARQVPDRDLDGNVRTWANGDPRSVWVFDVDTDNDGIADHSMWVKGNLYKVLLDALKEAGINTIGAVIQVEHHEVGIPKQKGYNGAKLFTAKAKAGPPLKPKADAFTGGDEEPF